MRRHRHPAPARSAAVAGFLAGLLWGPVPARAAEPAPPAMEGVEERLLQLEQEIRRLQSELEALRGGEGAKDAGRVRELEQQVDTLSRELERKRLGAAAIPAAEGSAHGLGPAASKVYRVERGVSIGGYGEMLYEDFDATRDDGSESGRKDQLDFVRAVFYFGYKFNDRILFNSEIEYEHASTGSGAEEEGEVSVEFAYLDFRFREGFGVRAGMMLVPVGFINELHEPPIFLGARRPEVERVILPTTWRENGAGIFGDLGPVTYRVYLMAGLDAEGFSAASGIRGGRQSGSESLAEDLALAGRADWTVAPGLLIGASVFGGNSGQGSATPAGDPIGGRISLYDLHAEWKWRGLQTRALFSRIALDDAAEINELQGLTGDESVGERLEGWYLEAGYDLLAHRAGDASLVPYVRYERTRTQEEVPAGFASDPANDVQVWTAGIAYRPIPQVVIKVDYQNFDNAASTGVDQFNAALGFLF